MVRMVRMMRTILTDSIGYKSRVYKKFLTKIKIFKKNSKEGFRMLR